MTNQEQLEQIFEEWKAYQSAKDLSMFYANKSISSKQERDEDNKKISHFLNIQNEQTKKINQLLEESSLKNRLSLKHLFNCAPDKFQKYLEDAVYTFQWEEK